MQVRWQFLATAFQCLARDTEALLRARSDEPRVWIELGGQLTRLDVGQETFSPVFPRDAAACLPLPPITKNPHQSVDETGKLSFRPLGSDWVLSTGVSYGRSARKVDKTSKHFPKPVYGTLVQRAAKQHRNPLPLSRSPGSQICQHPDGGAGKPSDPRFSGG